MDMSEKLVAISNPEYGKHYSSLPDKEILRLWNTTPPKDTERYFIYREILGSRSGLESRLASSQNNRPKFLWDDEYLVAEYRECGWPDGGFATTKSMFMYFYFVFVPIIAMGLLLRAGVSDPVMLWIVLPWNVFLFFNSLVSSHLFLTNQRIGYQPKLFKVFKLFPKFINLNDGYFISGLQRIFLGFFAYFMSEEDSVLKNT